MADSSARSVAGLFDSPSAAQRAMDDLKRAGFTRVQISSMTGEAEMPNTNAKDDSSAAPADFFSDHSSTGTAFVAALQEVGLSAQDAKYFEHGLAHGKTLVTVDAGDRRIEAQRILTAGRADLGSYGKSSAFEAAEARGEMAAADAATRVQHAATDAVNKMKTLGDKLSVDKGRVQSGGWLHLRKDVATEPQGGEPPARTETLESNGDAGVQR